MKPVGFRQGSSGRLPEVIGSAFVCVLTSVKEDNQKNVAIA